MSSSRKVVVTGLGCLTPIGLNLQSFWDSLSNGVSGAASITAFDTTHYKSKFACELKGFNPLQYLEPKEVNRMDRFSQLAVIAGDEALKDAGLLNNMNDAAKQRTGVIIASGIGGLISFQKEVLDLAANDMKPRISPFFIPKMIIDIASGLISMRHGLQGPNYSVVSACASSSHAIIDAVSVIQSGKADIILAGGSEAVICETGIGGFNAMKALSVRNDDPKTASRPYDKDRDGFVMGEGAGVLVLEEYEFAKKRGARIYAEVTGSGCTADAHHLTAPHPEGLGALKAMENALNIANINYDDIDYINTHGTSTPLGDIAELKAIQSLFKDHAYELSISSTKSMTGHLLGATGVVEVIASILALYKGIIPPTINHFTDDPEVDSRIDFTFNQAKEKKVNAVLSNTFGFGGHNASIILQNNTY